MHFEFKEFNKFKLNLLSEQWFITYQVKLLFLKISYIKIKNSYVKIKKLQKKKII